MPSNLAEILKLSVTERLLLVEAIWDSIIDEKEKNKEYTLSIDQINFLEEEITNYAKNPEEGKTWEEIKNRLRNKK